MGDFMSGVFAFCDSPCDHSMRKQTNLVDTAREGKSV